MVMKRSPELTRIPDVSPWRKSTSILHRFPSKIPEKLERQSDPLNRRIITNLFVLLISVNLDRFLFKETNLRMGQWN